MKIIYLDQNHWIELSRAYYREGRPATCSVLLSLLNAKAAGRACFPLSLAHYLETHKQRDPVRRGRLAPFMMWLSGGRTIAPPDVILDHEIQDALARRFPGRVQVTRLELLGTGLSHAADRDFSIPLKTPPEASALPPVIRETLEDIRSAAELSLLSGILPDGTSADVGPLTDLTAERRFKAGLGTLRGSAKRATPKELKDAITAITLADIRESLQAALDRNGISVEEFVSDPQWLSIIEDLPSRRADMHLRGEWAKNENLTPKDSDLNDWAFLEVAATHCDVVVTEKQIADLFSRGFICRARVTARLSDLPSLVN